ncbi:MAG: hypothetical protein WCP09_02470 [Candidatus Taylorbacteria bacterium]
MSLSEQIQNLSHHAYTLVGSDAIVDELINLLTTRFQVKSAGNQDFIFNKYTNFSIDDAREIKSAHLMRPVTELGKKIFVLQMDNITLEAQNSFLKLLEEPAEYAHFFLIVPSIHLLLPTVKSRLHVITPDKGVTRGGVENRDVVDSAANHDAAKFMKLNRAYRLEMVKDLMDKVSKDKLPKQHLLDILNSLQVSVYREKGIKIGKQSIETIELARKYMNDRSPSLKMLLEYVAVSI